MGKFEVFKDKKGEFRFRLKANNGKIICQSEGYKSKQGCMKGIESVCVTANYYSVDIVVIK